MHKEFIHQVAAAKPTGSVQRIEAATERELGMPGVGMRKQRFGVTWTRFISEEENADSYCIGIITGSSSRPVVGEP